jgi:RNA polymerase sigma factor for flagellar operon FliA
MQATPRIRPSRNTNKAARAHRARAFAASRSIEQQTLLTLHIGLVHHVARQLAQRLSTEAQLDELVSAGSLGLIQAVDSFDSSRGLAFSTYAVPRIRGAMLDELRRQDHVPRSVRRKTRDVSRAKQTLTGALRREPTEEELSRYLAVSSDMLRQWELDAEGASISSLDQPVRAATMTGATLGDTLTDDRHPTAMDNIEREEELSIVRSAIGELKEQERTVLALNFFEELKLQEIAEVLGLSVCRISQIRTAALGKLRLRLSGLHAA